MIIAAVDTETSGLNTTTDIIHEIGVILYDTEAKAPLRMYDTFIRPAQPLPAGYVSPTGIKEEWLRQHGVSLPDAFGEIQRICATMDPVILLGHNIQNYDKPLIQTELKRHNIVGHALEDAHCIDTRLDLPFPQEPTSRRLVHLCAEYADFLNPFEHRALFDALSCIKLLEKFDFEEVLALSKIPNISIRAMTNYEQRQLAKDARFQWDDQKKIWHKQIRENAWERELAAAAEKGFVVVKLNG